MSQLLTQILSKENMMTAFTKVCANKGSAGVDGITVTDIGLYLNKNWRTIKSQILAKKYKPQPVLRVEIPKPQGGKRNLGIPTIVDRIIQQAIVQVITPLCEPHFQETSYGFRPNRSCEMAILKLLDYLNDGYTWIVDIDLEKFFDNVPQDRLMSYVHNLINDGDTESLIRKYLQAGVMIQGKYHDTPVGTPQGGNLSPLLSNIMLNELDKELMARGLRFVRYADDCVITVGSRASAIRVMHSVTRYIEKRLGLKVNASKTKITKPTGLKYLGFGFWCQPKTNQWLSRPHQDSVKRFKEKLKLLTSRKHSIDLDTRLQRLNWLIRGWINYFRIGVMKTALTNIDNHLRTRLRVIIWKQWKTKAKRRWGLLKLGVPRWLANKVSGWGNHYQLVACKSVLNRAISKPVLTKRGLVSCLDSYMERHVMS